MEKRIAVIMAKVFGIHEGDINENSSVNTIKQWDSLRHMQLIIALENEFDIEIDGNQIVLMINFLQIVLTIKELLNRKE